MLPSLGVVLPNSIGACVKGGHDDFDSGLSEEGEGRGSEKKKKQKTTQKKTGLWGLIAIVASPRPSLPPWPH